MKHYETLRNIKKHYETLSLKKIIQSEFLVLDYNYHFKLLINNMKPQKTNIFMF
jgi:hypothetical protein